MTNLKRIKPGGIELALEKAYHYRLLNEPHHAESICLDVLEVDSRNQQALVTLLLALTDQFPLRLHDVRQSAENLIPQLTSEYDQHYYAGIVHERWATSQYEKGPASRSVPEWLSKAMKCYELAEKIASKDNPDPVLRWNACARLFDRVRVSEPAHAPLTRDIHSEFGDDVPPQ